MKIPGLFFLAFLFLLSSCSKDDTPQPEEQELITTIRLIVTDSAGTARTFNYRVENGFGSTAPGSVDVDSMILPANLVNDYLVEVRVLNESATPVDDVTDEIVQERDEHLFLFAPTPSGSSTIGIANGSTDNNGRPFNQTIRLSTISGGSGTLTVTLLHAPTNKNGQTPAEAAGETDAEAVFPFRIEP